MATMILLKPSDLKKLLRAIDRNTILRLRAEGNIPHDQTDFEAVQKAVKNWVDFHSEES